MQVKGMEISAYNCKFIPGIALAFGMSPIGAHHKESSMITFEVKRRARIIRRDKARRSSTSSGSAAGSSSRSSPAGSPRSSWVGHGDYPTTNRITGKDWKLEDFWPISDRIYAMMKLFWLREYPETDRWADFPPAAWFDPANADAEEPIAA